MPWFKKIIISQILFLLFLVFPANIFASEEFDTSYQITYTVTPQAQVLVDQQIVLTNKLANVYLTEYQISLGTTKISQISAWEGNNNLTPEIEKNNNLTLIKLKFKQIVVGKGNQHFFGISFVSEDLAERIGQVVEVGIPKLEKSNELTEYQVTLKIPVSFGQPIFLIPEPQKSYPSGKDNVYEWDKNQLADKSIIASFGNEQFFQFNLNYHLSNQFPRPGYFEISLPPDTRYQKVYYQLLEPKPENITVDQDGNWLAKYLLPANSQMQILASGSAVINLVSQPEANQQLLTDPSKWLQSQKYWETENETIKKIAADLKTPKNIYDYIVKSLTYDFGKINQNFSRLGAVQALNNKDKAVCMEFTDLFVTLCRSAGIPAREVIGFAYTTNPDLKPTGINKDILHSWPEYFDQNVGLWKAVDPTWENTTKGIDFFSNIGLNHFAFTIHGLSSESPPPPGSYKLSQTQTNDIQVLLGEQVKEMVKTELKVFFPEKIYSNQNLEGTVKLFNLGNVSLASGSAACLFSGLINKQETINFSFLPPFANQEQKITLPHLNWFTNGKIDLIVTFNNQQYQQQIIVFSPINNPTAITLIILMILSILGFVLFFIYQAGKNVQKTT